MESVDRLHPRLSIQAWTRGLLLILILVAFARLVWRLDNRDIWWDESLSLQRAESSLPTLLANTIVLSDGRNQIPTVDQHPFVYFGLLGVFIRLVGTDEFSLRFPSIVGATLLVPIVWVLGRRLARSGTFPVSTADWAAALMALHPFYLYYGQEARPYALWACLGLLSTYLLLRWAESQAGRGRRYWFIGYVIVLGAFLGTHYFSVFLLPIHAVILYTALSPRGRRIFLCLAAGGLLMVGLIGVFSGWSLSGRLAYNSDEMRWRGFLLDLVSALGLGISAEGEWIRWLWPVFLLMALVGVIQGVRSRRTGWLLPAFVVSPIVGLAVLDVMHPMFLILRYMSVIGGAFILLVAGGIGWAWNRNHWIGGVVAAGLLIGMVYSTHIYFTKPDYGGDDFKGVGDLLRQQLQPGDLVLLDPPEMVKLYSYYLPLDGVDRAGQTGPHPDWEGVPPFGSTESATYGRLDTLRSQYRRIWLVESGMFLPGDALRIVRKWMESNTIRFRYLPFVSGTSYLEVTGYLSSKPISDRPPDKIQHPLDVVFEGKIRLLGYEIGESPGPGGLVPVTLYWQALQPLSRNYKYILRLEKIAADGTASTVHLTEREPYEGALPTTSWLPGSTVLEYTDVVAPLGAELVSPPFRLTLQMYDRDTLVKLPITSGRDAQVGADGETLILMG